MNLMFYGRIPVTLESISENRLKLTFRYHPKIIQEIKAMAGARWNPDDKSWTITDSPRNWFQLLYLSGNNPYARYDQELIPFVPTRPLYSHQIEGASFVITRRQCMLAMEMGIGKTLILIEVLEYLKSIGYITDPEMDSYWIGPKSALVGVQLEFKKWKAKVVPRIFTYEAIKSLMKGTYGIHVPKVVVFDESSRAKTPSSQRSVAAAELADEVRKKYKNEAVIVCMTGTPAPKSPLDWWNQLELACPGFIREGTYEKFRNRLGLIEKMESDTGGVYPRLVTWWDDENKCKTCGKPQNDVNHDPISMVMGGNNFHNFEKSTNEITKLYERMKGLVHIKFKKDCLRELPDKIYRIIEVEPTKSLLRAAQLIADTAPTTIQALTLLRELSDGFQYRSTNTDEKEDCTLCRGTKNIKSPIWTGPEDIPQHKRVLETEYQRYWEFVETVCTKCKGQGFVTKTIRDIEEVTCPKDHALRDLLDEYEEVGRVVIYGGFTGTVDRVCKLVKKSGWDFIRVDGRGWYSDTLPGNALELNELFQDKLKEYPKVAFIGQPGAGGMGLTLTASPVIIYFSNDFNGESRMQSEDRVHRPGMDLNKGATIIDIIHLESDRKVLNNLQEKKDLQSMSLGEIKQSFTERVF